MGGFSSPFYVVVVADTKKNTTFTRGLDPEKREGGNPIGFLQSNDEESTLTTTPLS